VKNIISTPVGCHGLQFLQATVALPEQTLQKGNSLAQPETGGRQPQGQGADWLIILFVSLGVRVWENASKNPLGYVTCWFHSTGDVLKNGTSITLYRGLQVG
jgi:hypothetical protein